MVNVKPKKTSSRAVVHSRKKKEYDKRQYVSEHDLDVIVTMKSDDYDFSSFLIAGLTGFALSTINKQLKKYREGKPRFIKKKKSSCLKKPYVKQLDGTCIQTKNSLRSFDFLVSLVCLPPSVRDLLMSITSGQDTANTFLIYQKTIKNIVLRGVEKWKNIWRSKISPPFSSFPMKVGSSSSLVSRVDGCSNTPRNLHERSHTIDNQLV